MTYVVGIRRFGTVAIITDSLLSGRNLPPNPGSIKSGVLFPGCIFGISGNWRRAWDCVAAIRAGCTQVTQGRRFRALTRVIYRYNFPPGDHNAFEILLSSRHTGAPTFYLISSASEAVHPIRVDRDLITLGSGKEQLDELLVPYSETLGSEARLQEQRRRFTEGGHAISDEDFAHLYAFLIFQRTCGDAGARLAAARTGGFVHFIFQDGRGERRQKPRLYVLGRCDEHGNLTDSWAERLAFDHDPVFGDLIVIMELGGRPPKPRWSVVVQNKTGRDQTIDDWRAWVAAIEGRQQAASLYEILIAGRVDFKRRGVREVGYAIFLDTWNGTPALDLEGRMQSTLLEFLKQHT